MTSIGLGSLVDPLRSRFLRYSGIAASRWRRLPEGLYVFTFHRIGDPRKSDFDPNVFSCDAAAFDRHIAHISDNFTILRPSELDKLGEKKTGRYALLTFDDGYRDNLEAAVPVLERRRLEAIFFVATGLVDSEALPWWDAVAHMVRHARSGSVQFGGTNIKLREQPLQSTIRAVLRAFKSVQSPIKDKLNELESGLSPGKPLPNERLIMNWNELREAQRRGMTIGSHTVNHPLLAHLNAEQQRYELLKSKEILEDRLQKSIDMLAYPVGGADAFTDATSLLAKEAGYQFAFTNIPKRNELSAPDRFKLGRVGVSTGSSSELQLYTSLHC